MSDETKTFTGVVQNTDRDKASNNNAYMKVNIDGTYFSTFDRSLFPELQNSEGQEITVTYEEDDNGYRNINGIGNPNNGGQGGGNNQQKSGGGHGYQPENSGGSKAASNSGSQPAGNGMTDQEVRSTALTNAVNLLKGTDREDKIRKYADRFVDYIKNGS